MKPGKGGRPKEGEKLIILERRQRVARAYQELTPQWKIAQAEGVSQQTISQDLAFIREQWRQSMLLDADQRMAQELAKIDDLEAKARAGWERSCQDAENIRTTTTAEGTQTVTTRRGQAGDPRFLDVISKCIQDRCKLLGLLDERNRTNISNTVNIINWDAMCQPQVVPDRIAERLEAERQNVLPLSENTTSHSEKPA